MDVTAPAATGELGRMAERFGLRPRDDTTTAGQAAALAAAIQCADPLWTPPRPGQVQRAAQALCGGRAPDRLIGVELWPVVTQSGPALVLADARRRARVVVDVHPARAGVHRPRWVAASAVVHSARMPGSFALWQHWRPELTAHAPHDWTPTCDGHVHLDRPNAQGMWTTAIPRHDAWMMSRSWLPAEIVLPHSTDARWIVLGPDDRPLRQRDPLVRSTWDVVCFEEFAAVMAAHFGTDAALDPAVATVVRLMLPGAPAA